jgi:hypothetical protein
VCTPGSGLFQCGVQVLNTFRCQRGSHGKASTADIAWSLGDWQALYQNITAALFRCAYCHGIDNLDSSTSGLDISLDRAASVQVGRWKISADSSVLILRPQLHLVQAYSASITGSSLACDAANNANHILHDLHSEGEEDDVSCQRNRTLLLPFNQ